MMVVNPEEEMSTKFIEVLKERLANPGALPANKVTSAPVGNCTERKLLR